MTSIETAEEFVRTMQDPDLPRKVAERIEVGEVANSHQLFEEIVAVLAAVGVAEGFPDAVFDRMVCNHLRIARSRIGTV